MEPSSTDFKEVLKRSVVEHFLSGYSRILREGGLITPVINQDEVSPIDETQLEPFDGSDDTFNFNSDFKVQHYKITFHGTINIKMEIKNEAFSGKKDFFI